MRSSTKTTLGLVTLGLFASSYQMGLSAQTGFTLSTAAATDSTSNTEAVTTAEPSTPATPSATEGSAATGSSESSQNAASSESGTTASTPAPKQSSSGTTSGTASGTTTTASVSQTSAVIDTGKGYGLVQVEVVKTNGKITDINMIRAEASDGRAQAFPSLVAAAVAANGTGFGNVSGATYTTAAFKKAVESALAKF